MLFKSILLLLVIQVSDVLTTRVKFNNYCDDAVLLTESNYGDKNLVSNIPVDGLIDKYYGPNTNHRDFQSGYYDNATVVSVYFNYSAHDDHYIFANNFDLPVSVSSVDDGIVCLNKNYPDDYSKPTGKRGVVETGSLIIITFCPYSVDLFEKKRDQNDFPLISTIKDPTIIKPIRKQPRNKSN